jgi:putative hydrolase of the HAD superfamily
MAAKGIRPGVRAVLLDALGTLVELQPPAPRLRAALRDLAGVDVGEIAAGEAVRAEIGYYRAHMDRGATPEGLAALRRDCAGVIRDALGDAAALDDAAWLELLARTFEFRPYPDAAPALAALRELGVRRVVISNWDVSLHERLAETGLAPLLDGAVASAEIGSAKPAPEIFRHALGLAGGVDPAHALHVGDTPAADVEGARAAGIEPVFLARHGEQAPPGVRSIASLAGLPGLLG